MLLDMALALAQVHLQRLLMLYPKCVRMQLTTINVAGGTYTDESINITSSNLTISGAGSSTIFDGDLDGRFLTVNASNFTISDMKVKEYGSTNSGGAIYVYGDRSTISFNNIDFSSNSSTEDGDSKGGGAVYLALGSSTRTISLPAVRLQLIVQLTKVVVQFI